MPLISDLFMELDNGNVIALNPSFSLPPGLPGIGANDSGDRAPDSTVVTRSGDELPTIYSVTVTGTLSTTDPTAMLDMLGEFQAQLRQCRRLWRADRAYLPVAYGLLPQPEMGTGWFSARVSPIFRLSRVAWLDRKGNEVFG